MTSATHDTPSLLETGRVALRRGQWSDAAAAFSGATGALPSPSRESAEAWAGLGLASYWLSDVQTAIEANEQAFRQYCEVGEPAAAARAALWLVDAHLAFLGASAVANGWLEQAERVLAELPLSAEHVWLIAYRGHYALLVDGDAARALELGREGQPLARAAGAEADVVLLALEGLALVMVGEVRTGMARLDAASAAAVSRDLRDLNAVAWACCYLVHGCESVRDFPRAAEWCQRVMAFCTRWGLSPVYASCRLDYATVLTWRGEWAAAETELDAPSGSAALGSPPALETVRLIRLAELRRRQGRLDDAEKLLESAGEHPLAIVIGAAIALDRDEPVVARDLSDRVLRLLPAHARVDRVDPLVLRVRSAALLDDEARATADVAELASIAEAVGTDPFLAAAAFARGVLAAARGDTRSAQRAFEDAVVLYDRGGAPYEAGHARLELAAALARAGHGATARREAAQARNTFATLGASRDVERVDAFLNGSPFAATAAAPPLSRREIEVLRLVARGCSNQRIAEELFLSPHTVKRHLANILRKLDSPSRAAAVARAAATGLL